MNRRDFLKRLTVGGVAAAAAVQEWPFRVFSFPSQIKIAPPILINVPPEIRIRFIRAFDPAQAKMVNRWDVLYGFMKLEENPRDMSIKIAGPEEARKLGLVDPRYADAIEHVCRGMTSEFETTAIAPPQRFLESWESEKS